MKKINNFLGSTEKVGLFLTTLIALAGAVAILV